MPVLGRKNKIGRLQFLDANQVLLFVEKILSQNKQAFIEIGRLNCHA